MMNNNEIKQIQAQLGYEFRQPRLLWQAFTRRTYAKEQGTADNEVLEFYGDKALEFVVMKKLSIFFSAPTQNGAYMSQKTEGELTDLKQKLVRREMLAHRIDVLRLARYLLLGKGDEAQNVQTQDSVKEDLFEAIVGAVAMDCGWDSKVIEDVVDHMLDSTHYLEHGFADAENDVDQLQSWCQKNYGCLPDYQFYGYHEDRYYEYELYLPVQKGIGFLGNGRTKQAARKQAARRALDYLRGAGQIHTELWHLFDAVGEPELERAINQLQELYQKGYIGEPSYVFEEVYDKNGSPMWRGECHVKGMERCFQAEDTSKKQAKKRAAYNMLCAIMRRKTED